MKQLITTVFLVTSIYLCLQVNYSFERYFLQTVPVIEDGRDRVWDFRVCRLTPVAYGGKLQVKTYLQNDTLHIDSFDGRTVSCHFVHNHTMYQTSVERLDMKTVYDSAKPVVRFPLLYGFEFSNTFSGTKQDKSSSTFHFLQQQNVKVVGRGRLLLPDGRVIGNAYLVKSGANSLSFYASGVILPLIEFVDNQIFFNDIDVENLEEEILRMPSVGDLGDNLIETVTVYPNPVEDYIVISCGKGDRSNRSDKFLVQIYDLSGKLHISQLLQLSQKLNVVDLPAGTYFLKIGEEVHKFVKK
ncbi:MAG: T9SS type A sorting domain-containing protein [Bacteroidales bacterium]|jgi:hypothetical protein|nr:T9SS type A sorting domain-containing protein [Bacteroidales bacterium]